MNIRTILTGLAVPFMNLEEIASDRKEKDTTSTLAMNSILSQDRIQKEDSEEESKGTARETPDKQLKLVHKFLTTLSEQVPSFLDGIQSKLLSLYNLDVSQYDADHVCWRTESMEEYTELISALRTTTTTTTTCKDNNKWCTLLIESEIGGRPIATFCLTRSIIIGYRGATRTINVVEIPAPKDGSPYKTGLEHVEFVIPTKNDIRTNKPQAVSSPLNDAVHQSTLGDFMAQYPTVKWNTKAKDKDNNPDVSLKIELDDLFGVCSVKFHLMPLARVIEYEISHTGSS
jgi:predicted metalloenzyme YecM